MAKKKKKATKKKAKWGGATGAGHLGFKVDAKERKLIKANAERFANGNVSAWLAFAAMHHRGHVHE